MDTFDLESITHETATEEINDKYRDALQKCTDKKSVMALMTRWKALAGRTYALVSEMSETDVKRFLARFKNQTGLFGNPDFMEIALPLVMLHVGIETIHPDFPDPGVITWGASFKRLVESGRILVEDGLASFVE